jgi:hypothetical protein
MTDAPHDAPTSKSGATPPAGDEHPLSLLLFSWMRTELFGRAFLSGLGGLCALLAALELVIRRHDGPTVDGLPAFYGVYGFLAFSIAVLAAWPLSRLLRRPETYYSEDDAEAEEAEGGDDR